MKGLKEGNVTKQEKEAEKRVGVGDITVREEYSGGQFWNIRLFRKGISLVLFHFERLDIIFYCGFCLFYLFKYLSSALF